MSRQHLQRTPPKCKHTRLTESCSDCRALKAQWNARLEQDLGEDIEQPDGNLRAYHSMRFAVPSAFNKTSFEAREEYYRMAGRFLHSHEFADKFEHEVWRLYSEGKSIAKILASFREHKVFQSKKRGIFAYPRKVHATINRLIKEMMAERHDD